MELHENSAEGLPPVKTRVTLGKEDLSVKVNGHDVFDTFEVKLRKIDFS